MEKNCRDRIELWRHCLPALVSRPARAACSGNTQRALCGVLPRRPSAQFSASHRYATENKRRHADSAENAGPRVWIRRKSRRPLCTQRRTVGLDDAEGEVVNPFRRIPVSAGFVRESSQGCGRLLARRPASHPCTFSPPPPLALPIEVSLQELRLGGLRRAVESVEVNDHARVVGAARIEREASSSSWIPPKPPFDMTRT